LWLLGFSFAMIVLIRPVNGILITVLFLDINSWDALKERLLFFLNPKRLGLLAAIGLVVFAPQLAYWYYLSGSIFYYSYGPEGFPYLTNPKILTFLFAPENGYFLYNMVSIPAFGVLLYWVIRKNWNGIFLLLPILVTIYLCGSWHIVSFGCSFSARPLVEYTPLLSLPLGFLFVKVQHLKWQKIGVTAFVALSVLLTQKLTYSYDYCFPGKTWEIQQWYYLAFNTKAYSHRMIKPDRQWLTPEREYSEIFTMSPKNRAIVNWRAVNVTLTVETVSEVPSDLQITTKVLGKDTSYGWYGRNLAEKLVPNSKQVFRERMWIPKFYPLDSYIEVSIWNRSLDSLRLESIGLKAE